MEVMETRFEMGQYYTFAGNTLIAVNPFDPAAAARLETIKGVCPRFRCRHIQGPSEPL